MKRAISTNVGWVPTSERERDITFFSKRIWRGSTNVRTNRKKKLVTFLLLFLLWLLRGGVGCVGDRAVGRVGVGGVDVGVAALRVALFLQVGHVVRRALRGRHRLAVLQAEHLSVWGLGDWKKKRGVGELVHIKVLDRLAK